MYIRTLISFIQTIFKYFIMGREIYLEIDKLVLLAEGTALKGLEKRSWVVQRLLEKYKKDYNKKNFINQYQFIIYAIIEISLGRR